MPAPDRDFTATDSPPSGDTAKAGRDGTAFGLAEPEPPSHGALTAAFGKGAEGRILFWIAVAFSAFQLATAAHLLNIPSQIVRAIHVGFLLLLSLPLLAQPSGHRLARLLGWGLGILGFLIGLYQWLFYKDLLLRSGDPNEMDLIVGTVGIVVLFFAAWRVMGPALPIISGVFLAYALFGQHLPAPLDHRPYDFSQIIDQMAFGTEGIYGIPIYVSSSYIFLFILFGAFLERTGMIRLFTDVSLGLVGSTRGGAAKVAVVASGMMGTISGSGVANVVTVGQFTIPLMKRFGYRAAFAGGVEATASMGGQIMPPVMGAVAFIMAETIGVPYAAIVKAAVIPALLYFGSAFWMVHLEAGRQGLLGLPRGQLPSARAALRKGWYLVLPLAVLVYLLFDGYTPLYSGTIGLALTAMLLLGAPISSHMPASFVRTIFWIALGLAAAAFFKFGIWAIGLSLLVLVAVNAVLQGGRETLAACRDTLADGAKTALPVGIACAIVGIIVGTMTLTGAATTFGQFVVSIGQHSLFLSLFLTMITCLILGMGIPTIPNYIITSSLAGPALLHLGVPLIVSHMFVFYFGILADLTPPVALAAFAAAPIARESGLKIGIEAVRIALAGFVVPFMAVYAPALMLQDGGAFAAAYGYPAAVGYIVIKACLSIMLWGAAATGFLKTRLTLWERALATVAAFSLVVAIPWTDQLGFVLAALFLGQHYWRHRHRAEPTATR
ncbi:MAG TPA: TRAP transporter permease [Hypericibacter adhaerens]|uniref:C4-dicarboxylate ABC transporter n=1 Tax=Hypericibacter adhaerens TaxID=2602016 RepID=A0A5J6MXY6_9PROT|nr:TRAP transporter permease [Hypericibacter adhaerens]QEX22399.1 C4-dicarboxylate ABC transporter [Hypericibacter adhaerens]HWA45962.1 TRAP transporter permease [Hypericibacter adhaerens]